MINVRWLVAGSGALVWQFAHWSCSRHLAGCGSIHLIPLIDTYLNLHSVCNAPQSTPLLAHRPRPDVPSPASHHITLVHCRLGLTLSPSHPSWVKFPRLSYSSSSSLDNEPSSYRSGHPSKYLQLKTFGSWPCSSQINLNIL